MTFIHYKCDPKPRLYLPRWQHSGAGEVVEPAEDGAPGCFVHGSGHASGI